MNEKHDPDDELRRSSMTLLANCSKGDDVFDDDDGDGDGNDDDDDDNFLSQEGGMTLVANCVTVAIKSRLFFPLGKAES